MKRMFALVLGIFSTIIHALDYPSHAPRILVPFPPGGAADTL